MKRLIAAILSCILLSLCAIPAIADGPMNGDILAIYEELMTGSWNRFSAGAHNTPGNFTYGDNEDYFLFISPTGTIYLAWSNKHGVITADAFGEITFSADGQYLMLISTNGMTLYQRQP